MKTATSDSLHRNAAWAFFGQGCYLGCQWLTFACFARWGGADVAGLFALGLAVTAPVMVLANLHLRELHASDARNEFLFAERLAVRLGALLLALVGIAAWLLLTGWITAVALVVFAVAVMKAIESLADLGYGALQGQECFSDIALAQVRRGLIGLAGATTVFLGTNDVLLAVLTLTGGWLMALLVFDLPRIARLIAPDSLRPSISLGRLKALLGQALPMGLVAGIGTMTLMFPSYVIQHHLGTDDLGHYTAVLYLLMAGSVGVIALGQATSPRLARAFADGDSAGFRRLVLRLCLASAGLGIVVIGLTWACGPMILGVIYGDAWRGHASLLVWLAVSAAVQWTATALGFAATAARRLTVQVPLSLLACLASGVTSWEFVASAGLIGAAWSGMVTGMIIFGCYAVLIMRMKPAGIR